MDTALESRPLSLPLRPAAGVRSRARSGGPSPYSPPSSPSVAPLKRVSPSSPLSRGRVVSAPSPLGSPVLPSADHGAGTGMAVLEDVNRSGGAAAGAAADSEAAVTAAAAGVIASAATVVAAVAAASATAPATTTATADDCSRPDAGADAGAGAGADDTRGADVVVERPASALVAPSPVDTAVDAAAQGGTGDHEAARGEHTLSRAMPPPLDLAQRGVSESKAPYRTRRAATAPMSLLDLPTNYSSRSPAEAGVRQALALVAAAEASRLEQETAAAADPEDLEAGPFAAESEIARPPSSTHSSGARLPAIEEEEHRLEGEETPI